MNPDPQPPPDEADPPAATSLKERLWRVIFLSDTPASRGFDVALLWLIGFSVLVVMLESVESIRDQHGPLLSTLEWIFTAIFTAEYIFRVWLCRKRLRYVTSFFGIVDLISILPTFLEFFLIGSGHFIVIRVLRLLRMFRVLKMASHMGSAYVLVNALQASRSKISVFLFGVLSIVCIESTLMYILEFGHPESQFTSIPLAIYWGIVTITTVGYGDITPVTVLGKMLASVMMLTGFAIIAVPTGIVSAELSRGLQAIKPDSRGCSNCGQHGHDPAALYCKMCGQKL
ncbi:MAG: voltage-gated potassium channel [Verrucomicrobiales bacterium]|jgi:voltage-gated potassium channel